MPRMHEFYKKSVHSWLFILYLLIKRLMFFPLYYFMLCRCGWLGGWLGGWFFLFWIGLDCSIYLSDLDLDLDLDLDREEVIDD